MTEAGDVHVDVFGRNQAVGDRFSCSFYKTAISLKKKDYPDFLSCFESLLTIYNIFILRQLMMMIQQAWPSGPRRSVQVRVCNRAWVRTPPLASKFFFARFGAARFFARLFLLTVVFGSGKHIL